MNISKSNFLETVAIAVAGVVSSNTISFWKGVTSSNALVVIFTGIASIVIYETIILLFERIPKRFSWSRKLIDSRAKYEGFYLEIKHVDNCRSYAIVCLIYNFSIDDYQLSGTSLDKNGMLCNNWKSSFVKIDPVSKQIIYAQTGQSTDTSKGLIFEGVTYMNFDHFLNRKPSSGIGHYVDTIPAKSDFAFQKISEEECKQLIGKEKIENMNDYKSFVKNYHENNHNTIFAWENKSE